MQHNTKLEDFTQCEIPCHRVFIVDATVTKPEANPEIRR